MPDWRRMLPDTLVGRTILVLLGGLVASQLAAVLLFSLNRTELAARIDSRHLAERVAGFVNLVESTPEDQREHLIRSAETPSLHIGWGYQPLVRPPPDMGGAPRSDVSPIETDLAERLPGRVIHSAFRLQGEPLNAQAPPPLGRPPPPPGMIVLFDRNASPDLGTGMVKGRPAATFISVALTDGTWLNIMAQADPHHEGRWHVGFLGPLLGGLVVVIVLSVLAVRRASQPLSLLAAAADRLGRDVGAPPVAVEGPLEVRAAAMAFNRMQFRLRRFVEDRTQMIAAISHDLRTPLTRMRLRAEFVEDDEARFKMLDDLDEMESMIAETLAFARDDAAREAREPVDLASMLRDLCEQFETRFAGPERAVISAGPTGVKRAFANLLENARKYADSAQMTMSVDESRVTVVLDDDGPGLPEAELERVFAPFYRLETSRNRETGGTGLGLAVARSAVRAHGGDIALANRAEGGLSVTVTLPA